jgi:hypothetical protein
MRKLALINTKNKICDKTKWGFSLSCQPGTLTNKCISWWRRFQVSGTISNQHHITVAMFLLQQPYNLRFAAIS